MHFERTGRGGSEGMFHTIVFGSHIFREGLDLIILLKKYIDGKLLPPSFFDIHYLISNLFDFNLSEIYPVTKASKS